MNGWKGVTGGVGLMLYAVIGVVVHYVAPEAGYGKDVAAAIPIFMAGLGILGVRLKLNK